MWFQEEISKRLCGFIKKCNVANTCPFHLIVLNTQGLGIPCNAYLQFSVIYERTEQTSCLVTSLSFHNDFVYNIHAMLGVTQGKL